VFSSSKTNNVRSVQLGAEKLNIATIKKIPTVFGEADVLRAILVLPGVKTVGEASTGFNVRGGATDQNLILFNGATIYNPSHFFIFSAFNPEVIKDVQLFKSSIPANMEDVYPPYLYHGEGKKRNLLVLQDWPVTSV
jgi:hypothetical protein